VLFLCLQHCAHALHARRCLGFWLSPLTPRLRNQPCSSGKIDLALIDTDDELRQEAELQPQFLAHYGAY